MKRTIAVLAALVLSATAAQAQVITRDGSAYSGYANPGGCVIFVHDDRDQTELHVNCAESELAARIRYRFLRDVDGMFAPADVTVDWSRHGGQCEGVRVRWMVPTPRTVRVIVPAGCYAHIHSVTWDQ
jgi:hypothetical protein